MASSGGAGAPAPSLSDAIASLHAAPELAEVAALTAEEITQRTKMLVNGQRSLKSDLASVEQALRDRAAAVKDNEEKVLLNKALPYLVGNVVEVRGSAEWAGGAAGEGRGARGRRRGGAVARAASAALHAPRATPAAPRGGRDAAPAAAAAEACGVRGAPRGRAAARSRAVAPAARAR